MTKEQKTSKPSSASTDASFSDEAHEGFLTRSALHDIEADIEADKPKPKPPRKKSPGRPKTKTTLKDIVKSRWLRLTHLYYTKDKKGHKVRFNPWPEQAELLSGMAYLNVILKARQRGITTAIQLFMLDACLFNKNINAGVIAHNQKDAQAFFRDKIKFAYDNLPEEIKGAIKATNDNSNELLFSNGSSIRVGTSMRSGTLQYLHISEYGKICAKYPEKAEEIRSGSLNTVAPGCFVFIESTAEGAHGHFHELCTTAEEMQLSGQAITDMDYKFFFFPWWRAKEYRLHPKNVEIKPEMQQYFAELEREVGGTALDPEQKAWYVKKHQEQGDNKMVREYPSISAEAFRGIVEGAVFGKQMRQARVERRIIDLGFVASLPVFTFWDIGRDMTSIWFMQQVGPEARFIDFYQEPNRDLPFFARLLLQDIDHRYHRFNYGHHYFPHDMAEVDYSRSDQKTRAEVARSLGLTPNTIVDRISNLADGLEMTRQALNACYFDKTRCEKGIVSLENYRYDWNEKLQCWTDRPLHNKASHAADAFRQYAQSYRASRFNSNIRDPDSPLSRQYRQRQQRAKHNTEWRT